MWVVRKLVYKAGMRPKFDSIFYSPSLAFKYAFKDAMAAFRRGHDNARRSNPDL